MALVLPRVLRALTPFILFLVCVLAPGRAAAPPAMRPSPVGPGTCHIRPLASTTASSGTTGPTTVPAGTIPGSFSVTSSGEATYTMPLTTVPGRAGVEPKLALTYDSCGDDGVLGAGLLPRGAVGDHPLPPEPRAGRGDPRRPLRRRGQALPRRQAPRSLGPAQAGVHRVPHVPRHLHQGARASSSRSDRSRPPRSPSRRTCPPASSSSTGAAPAACRSRRAASRKRGWRPRPTTAAATP